MKKNFNYTILLSFLLIVIVFNLLNYNLQLLALPFFIIWLLKTIYETNNGFGIRNIFMIFFGLQYLLGPFLSYKFDNDSVFAMVIPSNNYFSFAFPAILLIGLGLFYQTKNQNEDLVFMNKKFDYSKIDNSLFEKLLLISIVTEMASFQVPDFLEFFLYFIYSLKYIYVCYILISKKKINYFLFFIPILILLAKALQSGMFHDLLTWAIFFGICLAIKVQANFVQKIIAIIGFIFLVTIIQLAKQNFRAVTWGTTNNESRIKLFTTTAESELEDLNKNTLIDNIVRINQGWITARTMNHIPNRFDHVGFELISKYLEAAFLPRFFAPDKLKAGDRALFAKYTGVYLGVGTSMGIGILGDAWASFGYFGGLVMLFCFGLLLNYSLKYFVFLINKFPLVYFLLPIVYYYPIRPDCETQTSIGHLVKTAFLVSIIAFYFMKKVNIKKVSILAPSI